MLSLIPNPTAQSEVRTTAACLPAEVERSLPWMCLLVEDYFKLLRHSKNLSQRGMLESPFNYPKREIEDPKTGKKKKLETGKVSCAAEG